MDEKRIIHVYVTHDRRTCTLVAIPADINEVELKAYLRDLGHILAYRRSYITTKVYLADDDGNNLKEICTEECRSLENLCIVEKSRIVIVDGEPEPVRRVYINTGDMRCLYGCPMARSVEEAINNAEKYREDESIVTTGAISEVD